MSQVDDLAKAFGEDVREVVALDNLFVASLIHDEEKVEAAIATVDHADFIVAPFVVRILVHRVVSLVHDVNETEATSSSLDKEWELDRVVRWQWHQVGDILVRWIRVLQLNIFLQALRIGPVKQVEMSLIPSSAHQFVVIVFTYVPNVLSLQVVLMASINSSNAN